MDDEKRVQEEQNAGPPGAGSTNGDTNEDADDKADVRGPDGEPVESADQPSEGLS